MMDEAYYQRQIKGLILIVNSDNNNDGFIACDYIEEKLNMILNGGIGFHPSILRKLDGEMQNE